MSEETLRVLNDFKLQLYIQLQYFEIEIIYCQTGNVLYGYIGILPIVICSLISSLKIFTYGNF